MKKGYSIAIDGPVASGKGTLAPSLAKKLHGFYMYTGAMYRCIALLCFNKGLNINLESQVKKVLPELNVEFTNDRVILNKVDVTERIKQPDTANGASIVSVYKSVRDDLVKKQQVMALKIINSGKSIIAEGRDTGTKVFPNAEIKIFLTANPEIRARRRMEQYRKKGIIKNEKEVLEEIKQRDQRDTNREIDPLVSDPKSKGYWVLDNSDQTEEESIVSIVEELRRRNLII